MDLDMQAFGDFALFLAGEPEHVRRYESETGRSFSEPTSAIEAMIDEATGCADERSRAFLAWAASQWSPEMEARFPTPETRRTRGE